MNSCIFPPKGKTKRPTTVDVVVPCFNEEESLTLFFASYAQLAKSHPQYAFNIIVIDNGSSDATLQIANSSHHQQKIAFVLNHLRILAERLQTKVAIFH